MTQQPLTPELLAEQITAAVNAPGERTQALEAQKVEATVASVISGLVEQLAQKGGVHIDTLNVSIGHER